MAITAEQALQAVAAAVETASGGTAVWIAQSDQVRPSAAPYYTVTLASDEAEGFPETTAESRSTPYSMTVVGVQVARFTVQGFGEGTDVTLRKLGRFVFVPVTALGAALRTAGVYPQRVGPVKDIAAFFKSGFEPRFSRDLIASYVISDSPAVSAAQAAGIQVDEYGRADESVDLVAAVVVP